MRTTEAKLGERTGKPPTAHPPRLVVVDLAKDPHTDKIFHKRRGTSIELLRSETRQEFRECWKTKVLATSATGGLVSN